MPQTVASEVIVLLSVPLAKHLVLEREPLAITPVLPLVFAFPGALFLAASLSGEPDVAGRFVGTYLTEGLLLFLSSRTPCAGSRHPTASSGS